MPTRGSTKVSGKAAKRTELSRAMQALRARRYAEAEQALTEAMGRQMTADACLLRSAAREKLGELAGARDDLLAAVGAGAAEIASEAVTRRAATRLMKLGAVDAALGVLQTALERWPSEELARMRATLCLTAGRTHEGLDAMRALGAEYLVPSHTRPVVGTARIDALLTEYRDGIRYVYDQTLRMINQGLTPDEIAARIRLPAHLADAGYLAQFYGKPTWSARSIFAGNLGWYDGNPSTLQPLPPDDEAARWAELAGGLDALAQRVIDAQAAGELCVDKTPSAEIYNLCVENNPRPRRARTNSRARTFHFGNSTNGRFSDKKNARPNSCAERKSKNKNPKKQNGLQN